MMNSFTVSSFTEHLNSTFEIDTEATDPIIASLIEVKELGTQAVKKPEVTDRSPFSLVFRCDKEIFLEQKIYKMRHKLMGDLEIFLVPIGEDKDGLLYEAIFN